MSAQLTRPGTDCQPLTTMARRARALRNKTRSALMFLPLALFLAAFLTASLLPSPAQAREVNGFELDGASIPPEQIMRGGPPRDGIPSLDKPKFVTRAEADFLKPEDRVLGIVVQGVARAYPVSILNWHEVVNDSIGDTPILVTFCPLCGTGMTFSPVLDGKKMTFGVSGLLYNSDVLLYDRQSESLWSQVMATSVVGPMIGRKLPLITTWNTSWQDWRARHPNTQVLSTDTGFSRDYLRNPYLGYEDSRQILFDVREASDQFHPKELVLALTDGERQKAWPFSELRKAGTTVKDTLNGKPILISYDELAVAARAYDEAGQELPALTAFWFAWYAFHPETEVFRHTEAK